MKKNNYIVGVLLLLIATCLYLMVVDTARADNRDCEDLRSLNQVELEVCLQESKDNESRLKRKYGETEKELEEHLALADLKQQEAKSLNAEAEAERVKQRIINRMLEGFHSPAAIVENN